MGRCWWAAAHPPPMFCALALWPQHTMAGLDPLRTSALGDDWTLWPRRSDGVAATAVVCLAVFAEARGGRRWLRW